MRMTRGRLFVVLGIASGLLVVLVGMRHLDAARSRYKSARESLAQLEQDATEVIRLRAQREMVAWRQRPTTDVLAYVNAALSEAGIPAARLRGIGEGTDTPLTGSGSEGVPLARQSLTISLEALSSAQIGQFLQHWLMVQDQWTGGRLEMTHRRDDKQPDLYDLRLHIGAVYIAGR